MDQENKKISFGFTKSTKKNLLFEKPPERNKKIQLIDCLESQKIKIKDARETVKGPLVIPMVQSVNLLDRRREAKKAVEAVDEKPESELTVEELAARELIREAQSNHIEKAGKVLILDAVTENVLQIEGKSEPTLDDYDSVPISDYGMAMLRGMGWKDGMGIGKNNKTIKVVEPALRPKGMGLGASNAQKLTKPAVGKDGKELVLQKGSFAKIVDGKKKGCYCKVQGFDDEASRIIVELSLDKTVLNLNELFVVPVTKEEYTKSSKVINIQKYEEYKDQESGTSKQEPSSNLKSGEKHKSKDGKPRPRSSSNSSSEKRSQERHRRYSDSSDEEDKKYSKSSSKKSSKDSCYRDKDKLMKKSKIYSSSNSSVENDYERKERRRRQRLSSSSDDAYSKHKRDKSKSEKYKNYSSDSDSKSNHRKEKHRYSKHSPSSSNKRR